MRYFKSHHEAKRYCKNIGLKIKPIKVTVWICPRFEVVWAAKFI